MNTIFDRAIQHIRIFLLLIFLTQISQILGQESPREGLGGWDVYIQRNVEGTEDDRLVFINRATSQLVETLVNGERYTPLGENILYFDLGLRRLMQVSPTSPEPIRHPFISFNESNYRVDWTVSQDGEQIAWTVTNRDEAGLLTSVTFVSEIDRTNLRVVLEDGQHPDLHVIPIGFSEDGSKLYLDRHPDLLSELVSYQQYAGLFSLTTETGKIDILPGEPGCFCGAEIKGNIFLRLVLNDETQGFDVVITDLESGNQDRISALEIGGYTFAGDVLISDDSQYAVYTLGKIEDFGTTAEATETMLAVVDIENRIQDILFGPIPSGIHPIAWTEDNTAVLVISDQFDGTWKVDLDQPDLKLDADATYIGVISD